MNNSNQQKRKFNLDKQNDYILEKNKIKEIKRINKIMDQEYTKNLYQKDKINLEDEYNKKEKQKKELNL